MEIILLFYIIWNLIVFALYGVDKRRAKRGVWRISETTLIVPAFALASMGALLGMVVFNHKTSKTKFRVLIPLSFLFNIVGFYFILKAWM